MCPTSSLTGSTATTSAAPGNLVGSPALVGVATGVAIAES